MKKIIIVLAVMVASIKVLYAQSSRYDCSAAAPSGQTLYYKIHVSQNYAEMVSPLNSSGGYWDGHTKPSGNLIIPETVLYNGYPYIVTTIGDYAFVGCNDITSVAISNNITDIGDFAFAGCNGLTSITIPSSVSHIENYAFSGCHGLTTVYYNAAACNYPNNHTTGVFSDDTSFRNLVIGLGVGFIPDYLFAGCSGLTMVEISSSVGRIGEAAFSSCTGLTSITIPANVVGIRPAAFNGCSNLSVVNFNAVNCTTDVTGNQYSSWVSEPIFRNCNALATVNIGDNVRKIPVRAFSNCSGLTTVNIGESLLNIGEEAFKNCINLNEINSSRATAPLLGQNAFDGVGTVFVTTNIPCGSLSSYISRWGNSFDYAEVDMDYSFNVQSANSFMGNVAIFSQPSCQSRLTIFSAIANSGYYFSNWSDGCNSNPRSLTLSRDTSLIAFFEPIVNDTIIVYDSMFIDVPYLVYDTIYINHYDTAYFDVHDTTYINVPIHDTTYITQTIHDTAVLNDTVTLTEYVLVHDTTFISQIDTLTLTQYDTITNTVYDTINNYIYDTLTMTDTLWLTQIDTVWQHDTIVIYDTIYITQESIDGVDDLNAKVYSSKGQIVVEGADGNTVWLYDINGRVLANRRDDLTPMRFDAPASGTYLIKIGNHAARKVVVIR